MSPTQRITKVEWVFVLVATLLGLGLRFWHLDRLAVEHFDEGVYSSNLFFTQRDNFRYPNQHLYAPPLVPGLIEWSMTFLGMEPWVPMIPGILLGAATVPLNWWMLRGLAGPLAAMLACWLLATNEYHIFYSRTALTEPVLGFFWVLALGLGARALLVPLADNPRRAYTLSALAGLACGLCWWTKYNGWLTAFLLTATAGLQWLIMERTSRRIKQNLIIVAVMLGVTVLVYSPYIWSLQPTGGYFAVSANHRQYFQGIGSWAQNWNLQIDHLKVLQSKLSGALVALSAVGVIFWLREQARMKTNGTWLDEMGYQYVGDLSIYAVLAFGMITFPSTAILVIWLFAMFVLALRTRIFLSGQPRFSLVLILLLVWLSTMLLLTPLYYPYPRLMLPGVIALAVSFGLVIAMNRNTRLLNYLTDSEIREGAYKRPGLLPVIGLFLLFLTVLEVWKYPTLIYGDRTGLAESTTNLVKAVIPNGDPNAPVIVYVYGEPAVYWNLSRQQVLAGPVSDLEFANPEMRPAGVSLYLVTGPHAGQTPAFATQMEDKKDLFEEVGKFDYEPSLLIKMDEVGGDPKAKKIETLTLWKVK